MHPVLSEHYGKSLELFTSKLEQSILFQLLCNEDLKILLETEQFDPSERKYFCNLILL